LAACGGGADLAACGGADLAACGGADLAACGGGADLGVPWCPTLSGPVVGAGIGGGALVGFESMISTVLSGSSGDLKTKTSVRSRRRSPPGNLRLSALK
jgi:hypothetical protein